MSGEATPADASGLKLDTEQVPADPSRQGVDCPFRQFGCLQDKLTAEEMSGHLQQEMRLHNELLIAMVANMNRDVERLKRSERSTRMRDISSRVSERSTGVSERRIWDNEGRWIGDDSEWKSVLMILEGRVRTCMDNIWRLECDDARKEEVEMLQRSVGEIWHSIWEIKSPNKDVYRGAYEVIQQNIDDAMMCVDRLREGRPCAHWIRMLERNVIQAMHLIEVHRYRSLDTSELKPSGKKGMWVDDESNWRFVWTVLEGRVRTCMEEVERLKCDDARKEEVEMLTWSVDSVRGQIIWMKSPTNDVSRGAYEVIQQNIEDAMKCVDSLREGRPCAHWIRMLQRNVIQAMHGVHFQSGIKSGADASGPKSGAQESGADASGPKSGADASGLKSSAAQESGADASGPKSGADASGAAQESGADESGAAQESGYRGLLPESDEMSRIIEHVDRIECDNKAIKLQIESMQLDIDRMKPAVQPAEVPSRVDASLDEWVIDIGLGDTTDWAGGESGRFGGGGGGGETPCYSHVLQAANSAGVEGASLRVHLLVVAGPHDSRLDWPFCGAVTVTVANRDGPDEASSGGGGGSCSLTSLCRIERPPDERYRCRHAAPFEFPHAALRAAGLLLERGVRLSCRIAPDEDQ